MELFSIQCATCHARLKVRDLAALGQILACPKCGSMVQVTPPEGWSPPEGADAPPTDAVGALHASPAPTGRSRDSNATTASDTPASSPDAAAEATAAGPIDWLAPQRRWQRRILAAGVVAILVLGLIVGLVERSRRQTTVNAEPQTDEIADVDPAVEPPPLDEAPAPPPPPVFDPRLAPADARLLISFDLAAGPQTISRRWFERLLPLWVATLEPIQQALIAKGNAIERFSWMATDLDDWDSSGIAVIELRQPLPAGAELLPAARALDWKLLGAAVLSPPEGNWRHPYAMIGDRTLVTGPEELLHGLAHESQPSPPADDVEPPREDEAAAEEAPVQPPTLEEPSAPQQPPATELAPSPRVTIPIPAAHDLAIVIDLAGETDELERWLPPGLTGDGAAEQQTPDENSAEARHWQQVHAWQWLLDVGDGVEIVASVACDTEAAAVGIEAVLKQRLSDAPQRFASLLAGASSLVVERSGSDVLLRAMATEHPAELGLALLSDTPAIEAVRQPAALAMGEPRLAEFAESLSMAAESDETFPAAAAGSPVLSAEARLSWIASLLPYYGHDDWHKSLNMARSWKDAANQPITRQPLPEAVNPAFGEAETAEGYPVTHYVGVAGVGPDAANLPADDPRAGLFGNQPRRWDAVRDGHSNTIAVMGVREQWGPWAAGGTATARSLERQPYVNGPDGFGTGQADGMLVGMADGSVRFVSSEIDPRVLEQLSTINGAKHEAISKLEPVAPLGVDMPPVAPADEAQPPPAEQVDAPAAPRRGGIRHVDAAARMQDPIRAIEVQRMPLVAFLGLVEELTRLTPTLDFERIDIPQAAQLPITVKLQDVTLGELLQQALAEHGLTAEIDGDQVMVVSSQLQGPPVRASYEIADLEPTGAAPEDPLAIANLVRQFVAPDTWKETGGEGVAAMQQGRLVVEQTPSVQRQIADFLERLRIVRGKSKLPAQESQARMALRWSLIQPKLRASLSANFFDDTPLTAVLGYLREKSGVDFVVDWRALHEAGAGPDVEAGLRVQNQPLEQAIETLLAPLGLAYRPIDARTIEITTPEKLAETPAAEFYSVRPQLAAGQTPQSIVERLREEVEPELWQGESPLALALVDPSSRSLIVRGPADLQRRVGEALAAWSAAGARSP